MRAVPDVPTKCNPTVDYLGCVWHACQQVPNDRFVLIGTVTGQYWSDSEFKFAHIFLDMTDPD